jgi:hypothetical protein
MIQEEEKTEEDDRTVIEINVIVRVWKQDCKRCNAYGLNKSYEDEDSRLSKIATKNILKGYFEELRNRFGGQEYKKRESDMNAPHQSHLCSACKHGICKFA